MAKALSDILKGVKSSKTKILSLPDDMEHNPGGKAFIAKHSVEKHEDRVGNKDDVYNGTTKKVDMKRHGPSDEDQKKMNESLLSEISKQKLTDYVLDARDDAEEADRQSQLSYSASKDKSQTPEKRDEFSKEYRWLQNIKSKREKGVQTALKKLESK